ncbi:hypothetical protein D3C86_2012820 [compost metagenome]
MQVEELADFARHRALQAGAQRMHFIARGFHCVVQPLQFLLHRAGGNALFGDFQDMRQAQPCPAQRNSARGAVPMQAKAGLGPRARRR